MNKLAITAENAEYQIIESLKTNRTKRAKHGEVFIEGIESIKQAVAASVPLTRIITANYAGLSGWAKDLVSANSSATVIEMAEPLYRKICDRSDPAELVVTAGIRPLALADVRLREKPFVLVFDRPSDHGNFGSILRSANSFNVDAVFVIGHGIDWHDPKVIRSSLGSVFHTQIVPVPSMNDFSLWIADQKKRNGIVLVGTDSTGTVSLPDNPLSRPIALVLGNEAKGMSVAIKDLCDYIVSIPISGAVNSLNVSCAGSIFLWDVYRNSRI